MSAPTISPQLVRSIIEERFKLNQIPLNSPLHDFNLNPAQVQQLQIKLFSVFQKDISVSHSDTIYTITDKLLV